MSVHTRTRAIRRAVAVAVLAALTLPLTGGPAHAVLADAGPVNPTLGFPSFYTDTAGLSLEPCLEGPPRCLTTQDELLNGPDFEGFYYSAGATAGGIDLELALEMAYSEEGQEIVFARTQYAAENGTLVNGADYTVTDPYGTRTCTANGQGGIANNACRTDQGADNPLDFEAALSGRIGPFLVWDPTVAPAAPLGYIGDGETPHAVIGSPQDFNRFRVEGPGITSTCPDGAGGTIANCAETDQFIVSGKVAPGPAATLTGASTEFGNSSTPVNRTFTYSSIGTVAAEVATVSASGPFTASGCAGQTVAPGDSCTITVEFTPQPGQASAGTLTVTDDTGASPRTIALTGRSLPVLDSTTTALTFGDRNVTAGPSASQAIDVTNAGAAPLRVTAATPSNAAYAADISACAAVAPGASCSVPVTFDPTAVGAANGTITLATDGGNRNVQVTGRGVQSAIQVDNQVTFGNVAVGQTKGSVLTLTNNGTAPLTLTGRALAGSTTFSVVDPGARECAIGVAVPVGGRCDIGLAFAPGAIGEQDATLTLTRADGPSTVVALVGRGVDGVRPTVTRRSPAAGAAAVRPRSKVAVAFSEAVTGVNRRSFSLVNLDTGRRVGARVRSASASRFVLAPTRALPRGTSFRVRLVGGAGAIRDLSGLPLRSTSWRFRTR